MAEYLIQDTTMTDMANQMRRLSGRTDTLSGAEIVELFTKTTGDLNYNGDYRAKIYDSTCLNQYDNNSSGDVIKSRLYNTGEICAMPIPPTKDGMTFQGWSCSSPLKSDSYVVVENSPIRAGTIYTPNDDVFVIKVEITEPNTYVHFNFNNRYSIDWGDGAVTVDEYAYHTYEEIGTYTIQIFNKVTMTYYDDSTGYRGNISNNGNVIKEVLIPPYITDINKSFFDECKNHNN